VGRWGLRREANDGVEQYRSAHLGDQRRTLHHHALPSLKPGRYILHHVPAPVLAVQLTVELAKRFSRQRIDPLLEETPALRDRVAPARARDSGNTMLSKEFPGGILVLTGANSAVGLRSMPARFLFLDEVDIYPGDIEGEGDPIALAEARARTFGWRRKAFLVSTPTIAGRSRIEREYAASDQRRYFLPCPHCNAMQ